MFHVWWRGICYVPRLIEGNFVVVVPRLLRRNFVPCSRWSNGVLFYVHTQHNYHSLIHL